MMFRVVLRLFVMMSVSGFAGIANSTPISESIADTQCSQKNIPQRTKKSAKGFRSDLRYMLLGNRYMADTPELERYANTVLDRIRACGSDRIADASVKIYMSPDFSAYTLKHGTIFISLGAILRMQNEDQLAALLAHEYAHVALKHHSKDLVEELSGKALDFTEKYYEDLSGTSKNKDLVKVKVADWLAQNTLFTSWNRQQETDADSLGLRLLIQAGYNGDAFNAMLNNVSDSLREQLDLVEKISAVEGMKSGTLDEALDSGLAVLDSDLSEKYETTEARKLSISNTLNESYSQRARPALRAQPMQAAKSDPATVSKINYYGSAIMAHELLSTDYKSAGKLIAEKFPEPSQDAYVCMTKYYYYKTRKKRKNFTDALLCAYQADNTPSISYLLLAEMSEKKKDYKAAFGYFSEMDSELDNPSMYLPDLIRLGKLADKKTFMYEARCFASMSSDLIQQCKEVR